MKDISIIVPFYNSAVYLRRCVASLCHQTISEQLEFVFVDDCSTDSSVDVIRDTLSELNFAGDVVFERHLSNKGSAIARETGIEASNGTFILFCDSDDWMDLDMCERLLEKAEQDNCDIVVCDYNKVYTDIVNPVGNCYSEYFFTDLLLCKITGSLCNKLIRRELLTNNEIVFPTLPFCEDYVITIQASFYANRIGYVPAALYNYMYNPTSITQAKDYSKVVRRLDEDYANYKIVESFLEKQGVIEKYRDEIIFHKLKMKNYIRNQIKLDKRLLTRWRNTFPELNRQIFKCKYINPRLIVSYYATWFGIWTGRCV